MITRKGFFQTLLGGAAAAGIGSSAAIETVYSNDLSVQVTGNLLGNTLFILWEGSISKTVVEFMKSAPKLEQRFSIYDLQAYQKDDIVHIAWRQPVLEKTNGIDTRTYVSRQFATSFRFYGPGIKDAA